MNRKLYIEYRLYFPPESNQDTILEMAEEIKDKLYDEILEEHGSPISVSDVTYEVIMSVEKES